MKLSEISDTVKIGVIAVAIIGGATSTTWAVRANTDAVNQLTASLQAQGKRIDDLERWRISSEAYAQAMKDLAKEDEHN